MSETITVTAPPLVESPGLVPGIGIRHRWTNAEFDRMLALGLLREGGPEFLWDGEIVSPMPEDPEHSHAQDNVCDLFRMRFPKESWTISQSHPVVLGEGFIPEPDLALLIGPRSSFRNRKPGPDDVALVVEVSNSSYTFDSRGFLGRYAKANIPQYWIVNIKARRVEVYSGPDSEAQRYQTRQDYGLDAIIPLNLTINGVATEFGAIAVLDVLQDSLKDV